MAGAGCRQAPGTGRAPRPPHRVVGAKGYTGRRRRVYYRRRGIRHSILRDDDRRTGSFDQAAYRLRNRVRQFRSLATRYERRRECYRAFCVVAMTILWLQG